MSFARLTQSYGDEIRRRQGPPVGDFAQRVSRMGRGLDAAMRGGVVGHMAAGDVVIPAKLIDREPSVLAALIRAHTKHGSDWREHVAGSAEKNPKTGLAEFAWPDPDEEQSIEDDPVFDAWQASQEDANTGFDTSEFDGGGGGNGGPLVDTQSAIDRAMEASRNNPTGYDTGVQTSVNTMTVPETREDNPEEDDGFAALARKMRPSTSVNTKTVPETRPKPYEAGGSLSNLINRVAPFIPGVGSTIGGTTGTGPSGAAVNAAGNFFDAHGGEASLRSYPQGGSDEPMADEAPGTVGPGAPPLPVQPAQSAPPPSDQAPNSGVPGLPGGSDPWEGVLGRARPTPTPNRITQSGFARPAAMPSPHFLSLDGGMTPLQARTAVATYGVNASDGMWRDPAATEYYKNELLRSLVGDSGELGDYGSVLPIEHQFLQQVLGLSYGADTKSLVSALGASAPQQSQPPPGSIPLENGRYMAPSNDGGWVFGGDGMSTQAVMYLDNSGNWTMDRSKAYLPNATAQLNAMANV